MDVKVRSLFLEDSRVDYAHVGASFVFTCGKTWARSLNQHEMGQPGKPWTGWRVSW